jgi:LuxR family maltose regulon positive regulatory protein
MARTTPQISDGVLIIQENAQDQPVPVESQAWWDWLNAGSRRVFYFKSALGSFTARREEKHGGLYWYAYRKRGGRLYKAYLGKSADLTAARLNGTAAALADLQTGNLALLETEQADQQPTERPPQEQGGSLLLLPKLSVPPAHIHLIDRPRLTGQLSRALGRKLTLISAPAGFGKTSLLSQWVQQGNIPAIWVSLDEADNDLIRFWSYIISALQRAHPALGPAPLVLLHTPTPPAIETVLTALLNAVNTLPEPIMLILDDYHVIEAPAIHRSVAFLLDHLPAQMRLVIASRTDPPLPLARLRARNHLSELHAADLRFNADEAAGFLNQAMDLHLPKEAVAALEERTEGWIAGLHLAALSLQGQSDIPGFIAAFTGSHRYIFDYLADEVLDRQPEAVQTFLLHTSILARLCGPLCEAITSQPQAQALLEQLEQANLFLVPLDGERRWYRYHSLFADVLRDRLQRQQPELVALLHRRAAVWHEHNHFIPQAVTHALAADDLEYAAHLIEQAAEFMLKRGEGTTFVHWVEALPEALVRSRPRLAFYHAGALIVVGQSDMAEARLQAIERDLSAHQNEPPAIGLHERDQTILGEISAARAIVAAYEGDVAQTLAWAQQALAQLPEDELFGRSMLAASLGAAYWWSGDLDAADKAFSETRVISQAARNAHASVASLAGQGYIQASRGKLRRAAEIYRQAIQEATEPDGQLLPVASLAQSGLGELLYQQNDFDQAERLLLEGIALAKQWGDPRTLGYAHALLAHVRQAQGHSAGTHALMEQAQQLAEQHHVTQLLTTLPASRAWLCLKQGDLDAAVRWADVWEPGWEARPRYPRDLEFAGLMLARVRIAQGQFGKAVALLAQMLGAAEAEERHGGSIEALALQALAYHGLGKRAQALRALARGLALAAPEGYIRVFVDEGKPMAALLLQIADARQARQHLDAPGVPSAYLHRLLAALGYAPQAQPPSISAPQATAQPSSCDLLSERALEVLRLVAAGLSNQEIAREMVVAVSTIKWHLKQVYFRLDAHNRAQAIKRARELHLLPE